MEQYCNSVLFRSHGTNFEDDHDVLVRVKKIVDCYRVVFFYIPQVC